MANLTNEQVRSFLISHGAPVGEGDLTSRELQEFRYHLNANHNINDPELDHAYMYPELLPDDVRAIVEGNVAEVDEEIEADTELDIALVVEDEPEPVVEPVVEAPVVEEAPAEPEAPVEEEEEPEDEGSEAEAVDEEDTDGTDDE